MQVQSLIQIIRALNEAGVQYLIVGGVAVNAHGFERYTKIKKRILKWPKKNYMPIQDGDGAPLKGQEITR